MNKKDYEIGLDCAPGHVRPGHLIGGVIKDTGLPERDPVSMVFGAWVWDYTDVEGIEEIWKKNIETIINRIIDLHFTGKIRGGKWTNL